MNDKELLGETLEYFEGCMRAGIKATPTNKEIACVVNEIYRLRKIIELAVDMDLDDEPLHQEFVEVEVEGGPNE